MRVMLSYLSAVFAAHTYMFVKMNVHSRGFAGATGVQTQYITLHVMQCRVLSVESFETNLSYIYIYIPWYDRGTYIVY